MGEPIELTIRGKSANAVRAIQKITGEEEATDVIYDALRLYEFILAQQAKDAVVLCRYKNGRPKWLEGQELAIVNYVKDKETADQYFKGREIY